MIVLWDAVIVRVVFEDVIQLSNLFPQVCLQEETAEFRQCIQYFLHIVPIIEHQQNQKITLSLLNIIT